MQKTPFRSTAVTVLVSLALVAAGCKKEPASSVPSRGGAAAKPAPVDFGGVPESAAFIATLSSPKAFWNELVGKGFVPMDADTSQKLDTELKAHVKTHLGLDVSAVTGVVAFGGFAPGSDEPSGAFLVHGISGTPTIGTKSGDAQVMEREGAMLAYRNGVLVVGTQEAVQRSLDVLRGTAAGLSGERLSAAKALADGAYVTASSPLNALPLPPNPMMQGIDGVSARVDAETIRVEVRGEPAALERVKGLIEMGLGTLIAQAEEQRNASKEAGIDGALAIMGYYNMVSLKKTLTPNISGNSLVIEMPMFGGSSGMLFVAIAGILAAIAIPAFMKYMKKAKSSEAHVNVKRLHAELALRIEQRKLEGAPALDPVGPTPPMGSCCNGGEMCQPDPGLWQHPTWQALNFSMDNEHYYSYAIEKQDELYIVHAYGDLDCDGQFSDIAMAVGSDSLLKEDELE